MHPAGVRSRRHRSTGHALMGSCRRRASPGGVAGISPGAGCAACRAGLAGVAHRPDPPGPLGLAHLEVPPQAWSRGGKRWLHPLWGGPELGQRVWPRLGRPLPAHHRGRSRPPWPAPPHAGAAAGPRHALASLRPRRSSCHPWSRTRWQRVSQSPPPASGDRATAGLGRPCHRQKMTGHQGAGSHAMAAERAATAPGRCSMTIPA